jgi:hypothetical protein
VAVDEADRPRLSRDRIACGGTAKIIAATMLPTILIFTLNGEIAKSTT